MILLGTDAIRQGNSIRVNGYTVHDELKILTQNGFTNYEAIATATKNVSTIAKAMNTRDDWGTIEEGKRADFILTNNNPLQDIAHIKDIQGVMAAGRWLNKNQLNALLTKQEFTFFEKICFFMENLIYKYLPKIYKLMSFVS